VVIETGKQVGCKTESLDSCLQAHTMRVTDVRASPSFRRLFAGEYDTRHRCRVRRQTLIDVATGLPRSRSGGEITSSL
jgi:hypothetical protein